MGWFVLLGTKLIPFNLKSDKYFQDKSSKIIQSAIDVDNYDKSIVFFKFAPHS